MNKKLKYSITTLTLSSLLILNASAYSWTDIKDSAGALKERAKEVYEDTNLKEKTTEFGHWASDCYHSAKETTGDLYSEHIKPYIDEWTRTVKALQLDVSKEEAIQDLEKYFHYIGLVQNIKEKYPGVVENGKTPWSNIQFNIDRAQNRIESAMPILDAMYGVSAEKLESLKPLPSQIDITKMCVLDSPICDDLIKDKYETAVVKLFEFWKKYESLCPGLYRS